MTEPTTEHLETQAGREIRAPASTLGAGLHWHPACIVCAVDRADGLRLRFATLPDGGVRTTFACTPAFQGYPGRLHGGVIATLLDAALTHCLFARGLRGVTAKLNIRYSLPVEIGPVAIVRAHLIDGRAPLYKLRGEIEQLGRRRVTADGTFIVPPPETDATPNR